MTSEAILHQMKILHHHNVSIHINFHKNRFINECARKILAKIPELRKRRKLEFL